MLFMLKTYIAKPADVSNKDFYNVWRQESEAALGAVKAGAIKGLWKVAGKPVIIAVLDLPSADDLDHAIHSLPIWKLGFSHIATDSRNHPAAAVRELGRGPQRAGQGLTLRPGATAAPPSGCVPEGASGWRSP